MKHKRRPILHPPAYVVRVRSFLDNVPTHRVGMYELARLAGVNGRPIGPMPPPSDAAGRPLPRWRGVRAMEADEYFTFSGRVPNSFDSRCFGPVRLAEITAVRRLAWSW